MVERAGSIAFRYATTRLDGPRARSSFDPPSYSRLKSWPCTNTLRPVPTSRTSMVKLGAGDGAGGSGVGAPLDTTRVHRLGTKPWMPFESCTLCQFGTEPISCADWP